MQTLPPTTPWRRLLVLIGLALLVAVATAAPRAAANPPCDAHYTVKNGVVTDNDTKLSWQQGFQSNLTVADATSYCANLSLDGGNFCLPTVDELQTLVDEHRTSPLIDQVTFPSTPGTYFWSSTSSVPQPTCQNCNWYVNFGYDATDVKSDLVSAKDVTELHAVRCVRCVH